MRNTLLHKRHELLKSLGGLPEPEVINEEWLYILKEETRNSILIEGVFVSQDELEEVLLKGAPVRKSQKEALNYFRAAKNFYEMAYQNFRTGEFLFSVSMSRQINKMIYEDIRSAGEYRKGNIKIAGAKITPPPPQYIEKWLLLHKRFVEKHISIDDLVRFIAIQHILFETIHPFEDGNGRTGRIILNYLLVSRGYLPVILKGDDTNRERYYRALEQGDAVLRNHTQDEYNKDIIKESLISMKTELIEGLISDALRVSLDRVLIKLLETKKGLSVKPAKEAALKLNYSPDSMRTLISRGKFIAVKRGKEWFTHEDFDLTSGRLEG